MKAILFGVLLLITACNQTGSTKTSVDTLAHSATPVDDPFKAAIKKLQDSLDAVNRITATDALNKAYVPLNSGDSTIILHANIRLNHRIFGYARPDTNSERLLLWSVFTNDVQGNPFRCRLGSYYETGEMKGVHIKYLGTEGSFIKATAIDSSNDRIPVYFEKKWIAVE